MAFQIKDDLFDYTEDAIGKPTGIDIKEQKMTLPLIYVLNTCTEKEKQWLINSVKKYNKDKKRVKRSDFLCENSQRIRICYCQNERVSTKSTQYSQRFPCFLL